MEFRGCAQVEQELRQYAENSSGDNDKLQAVTTKITRAKEVEKKKKKAHEKLKSDQQRKRRELEQNKGLIAGMCRCFFVGLSVSLPLCLTVPHGAFLHLMEPLCVYVFWSLCRVSVSAHVTAGLLVKTMHPSHVR